MQIIKQLDYIPNLSLALGFFDGIHLGHRKVIDSCVDFAKNNSVKSAVITFKEHPFCILKNIQPQYISTRNDSYSQIEQLGVDYLFELDFSKIYKLNANEFLENILIKNFDPSAIFTGYNHNFGANRTGNSKFLENYKGRFKYYSTPPQKCDLKLISSSAIRTSIKTGNIILANKMLGRNFKVSGIVQRGKQLGRTIGFPTININYPLNIVEPPFGVYKVSVKFDYNIYNGIANYGVKPTISNNNNKILEIHIFDFNNEIYNQEVNVYFEKMLRPEMKFDSIEKLKEQIKIDIANIV